MNTVAFVWLASYRNRLYTVYKCHGMYRMHEEGVEQALPVYIYMNRNKL